MAVPTNWGVLFLRVLHERSCYFGPVFGGPNFWRPPNVAGQNIASSTEVTRNSS